MIDLSTLDLVIIAALFLIILSVGLYMGRSAGKSSAQYFLSGRNMPWWLLGLSMVATTFSTDTPNLVTDIVRQKGVAGNWVWWAFLITGLLTVFVYARLWRKSNVQTDIEFYELRYGGAPGKFLRWFRALFLGVFFNMFAMAGVMLAAIKIGEVMLGLDGWVTLLVAGSITLLFSTIGGFKGVVYTDFILFFVAMAGALGAAVYIVGLPEVGGISSLVSHPNVTDKLAFIPDIEEKELFITVFIIPIAVQWWSSWYPGGEPGGGGYVAQRMLAAKDENHAIGATFFFNFMHIAIRPWPWILVALASLILFPDLGSIKDTFPHISDDILGHDLAYPAMLTKLPSGLLGVVLASLAAAFMSTISTHLNWGASYLVNDFYKVVVKTDANEKEQVSAGRVTTIILMIISALMALALDNALQLFNIIIMFGAGTGLIFILRWFWWRINAWTELSAMLSSGIISTLIAFTPLGTIMFGKEGWMPDYFKFPFIVVITSVIWLIVTYATKPETQETLARFYKKTTPGGRGWSKVVSQMSEEEKKASASVWVLPQGILAMILGCIFIYSALFCTGYFIYGETSKALILIGVCIVSGLSLRGVWKVIKQKTS